MPADLHPKSFGTEPPAKPRRSESILKWADSICTYLRKNHLISGDGIRIQSNATGRVISADIAEQYFFAKVTWDGSSSYNWIRVIPRADGTFMTDPDGRTGTGTGYEVTGSEIVPANTVEIMFPTWNEDRGKNYIFSHQGASKMWARLVWDDANSEWDFTEYFRTSTGLSVGSLTGVAYEINAIEGSVGLAFYAEISVNIAIDDQSLVYTFEYPLSMVGAAAGHVYRRHATDNRPEWGCGQISV